VGDGLQSEGNETLDQICWVLDLTEER
jgi:hypothetical protein